MVLRYTQRALALLGDHGLAKPPPSDDDWYLNLLWLERRKSLLRESRRRPTTRCS